MTDFNVKSLAAGEIPAIDISPLRAALALKRSSESDGDGDGNGNGSAGLGTGASEVARQLHHASTHLGFIYITGHGIPDSVITTARQEALEFFRASDEQKQTVTISSSHRGWLGQGGAKMHDDAKPDLKESYIWGYEEHDGQSLQDHPLRGDNQWPTFRPALKPAAQNYFEHAHGVAHQLMHGFALGLGLSLDAFLKSASKPLSRASFVYYPPQPLTSPTSDDQQFGVGPHTDFGVLTVLCQDDVGGLEVEDINGEWIAAPPMPGALVVNVGDLLSRWTAGAYKSTPHRVVNTSGRERLSLVLAFDPDPQTLIDPAMIYSDLPEYAEPAITCGDYLNWRFEKAFAYRKQS